ncbi:hypothetical protein TanjilG_19721 [Lupinus angustifolius]|uniref:Uncharacterized protein n=1 Tax=Lupinus angustifolius TaxID=3871 RepID=A0A4P1RA79_LUPAN|nr:hypothetical protein TanjilG_19721 [Lupinus angustifolius]
MEGVVPLTGVVVTSEFGIPRPGRRRPTPGRGLVMAVVPFVTPEAREMLSATPKAPLDEGSIGQGCPDHGHGGAAMSTLLLVVPIELNNVTDG